ncbi:hypothetical protein Tco_0550925 [Tanacetum coccineum]
MQDPKDHHLKAIKLVIYPDTSKEHEEHGIMIQERKASSKITGPNIPDFQLQRNIPLNESSYVSWLHSKPQRSVLCVSLGSQLLVSNALIDEMLEGVMVWRWIGVINGGYCHILQSEGDQLLNNKLIFEDWESGWRLKNGSSIVKRETIAVVVRWFMYLESELVEKLMGNAKRLGGICRESVEIGGRANKEIDCFIRESDINWVQIANF